MLARTDETEIIDAGAVPAVLVDEADALRQAVRDWVVANGSSYKSVAKMSGTAESTFTAWLNGKYPGKNAAIAERTRAWLSGALNFARQKATVPNAPEFVLTNTARKILAALEYAQAMPDIAVITGGAGVGKTSSIRRYKASYSNVWHLTARKSIAGAHSMLQYLRQTLGVPETAPFRLADAIAAKLAGTQGLIVVDEAQHLKTEAFDELRSLYDLSGVGLAFVGNHGVWERIDGGGRDAGFAQLYSRVGTRLNIAKSSAADAAALLDAAEIENAKVRALLSGIALRPGALRQMANVLRNARVQANGAEEELGEKHVEAAWTRLTSRDGGAA